MAINPGHVYSRLQNHPKLSYAQKLYYLRCKTKDQAGIVVKQFALNVHNFNLAWEALKSRYENERILVDKQVTILMNLPKIQKETSEEFMRLQSTVSNRLSVLSFVGAIALITKKMHRRTWQQNKEFLFTQYENAERVDKKITKLKGMQHDNSSFHRSQANSNNDLNRSTNFLSHAHTLTECESKFNCVY